MTPHLTAGHRPQLPVYDADIMILTINRFAETLEAVHSALAQRGASFHITVLDQGSQPGIRDQFAAAFADQNKVAYFTLEKNLGVAGGRNLLAELGYGRIIIGLDNDAVFETDSVAARAVHAFDTAPELGALGFKILRRDGVRLDEFSWGYPAALKRRFADSFDTTTFVGAGHAIRRLTWVQAGGYDSSLFFTWEEYDFSLAAISLNWLVRYDGSLGVVHKVAPESRIGWSDARVRHFVRNRLIISRKWGASWWQLSPRLAGYAAKGLLNRRLLPTLGGIWEVMKGDTGRPKQKMTPEMRVYCFRNETRYRGSLLQRLRNEVFVRMNKDP